MVTSHGLDLYSKGQPVIPRGSQLRRGARKLDSQPASEWPPPGGDWIMGHLSCHGSTMRWTVLQRSPKYISQKLQLGHHCMSQESATNQVYFRLQPSCSTIGSQPGCRCSKVFLSLFSSQVLPGCACFLSASASFRKLSASSRHFCASILACKVMAHHQCQPMSWLCHGKLTTLRGVLESKGGKKAFGPF